ncbi:relaxase/mobilization nuclease domain-containing protein [Mucilaginibacter sp. S1162]|uniref:Relaxase/mobilization nuclease domain-containing protein n=1 Tax=Mucilaginibacter humi TaxID=2732510 RepID=A0ABX1W465_9SPHI|nr:relaxase/mobilization nuclease domain-containing protein [Mucilaginibacter humi]NNU34413.1 relaxase/mobilization nuclease domain-containing protein [Mucilaginibacter humi]
MVAKIKTGRSISGAINYNEHKVRLGKAELILAQGYLKDPVNLTFSEKLQRLTDLAKRNERTRVNTLHVSLNFAVSENLEVNTLQQIADDYMEGLGFGKQPYLVYQHFDAGHPHLHVVTTNIEPDGRRISFHLLANRTSEAARKQVELTYGLVKAEDRGRQQKFIGKPLEQVTYGKSELKRAMTNVLTRWSGLTSLPAFPNSMRSLISIILPLTAGLRIRGCMKKTAWFIGLWMKKAIRLACPLRPAAFTVSRL